MHTPESDAGPLEQLFPTLPDPGIVFKAEAVALHPPSCRQVMGTPVTKTNTKETEILEL